MTDNKRSSVKLAVFQLHFTDTLPAEDRFNPVVKLLKSGLFDHVVVAVPDMEENRFLEEVVADWGAEIFFGDVENVTGRIYGAAEKFGAGLIVRPSIYWFYLDVELIWKMVEALDASSAEICLLPRNFDVTFGADVFRIDFLKRMLDLFSVDEELKGKFQSHPYAYAELYPDKVEVMHFEEVPVYDNGAFDRVVGSLKRVFPETGVTADKTYPYRHIIEHLRGDESVLDVACGYGDGTAVLASRALKVVGADLSEELVEKARARHGALGNVKFVQGDVFKLPFEAGEFDFVVSIHTMEHVEEDERFVRLISNWLKDGGGFALEVPLLCEYPFKDAPRPMNPYHVREYTVKGLEALLSKHFKVVKKWAVVRGWYTDISMARNSVMFYLRKAA